MRWMPLPDSERSCIFLPRRHRFMYGTEKMKNKIFRRFFFYCKNGATFGFRGRSIFLFSLMDPYFRLFYSSIFKFFPMTLFLIRSFMLYPCAKEGKVVFLFLDKSFYTHRGILYCRITILSSKEYYTARRLFASCVRR